MAEQKKKETRPTKPEGDDDAAGANPELAKKGKKDQGGPRQPLG